MSKNIYIYILIAISCIFSQGCSDFLDKQPDDMLTLDQMFANRVETEKYLRNVYSYLPHEVHPYENYSGVSDEGDLVWTGIAANNMNTGNWSPTYIPYDEFSKMYKGIRSASVFIQRVADCKDCEAYIPGSTLVWAAEARALRAWYYYLLIRKYGPVAILEDVIPVDASASDTQIPRNSYDECVDYIISELEKAQADLPPRISNAKELGKMDKRIVQAMMSRILLYAASPLWNGNPDFTNFRNADGKQLVNLSYDASKWQKAAEASKKLIDMMPEGLYKKNDSNGNFDPFLSYRDVFFDRWNIETIWARPSTWDGAHNWEQHTAPRQVNGWNGTGATQNQVDAYHMANGKQIYESGSGYIEEGFSSEDTKYTKAGDWNMYLNREPRFYASILYNGGIWPFTANGIIKVQLYAEGASGKKGSHDHTATGYLIQKFTSPNTDVVNNRYILQAYQYFRLAEIYLNYAEALNEYDPGNPDIEKYVNLIRERGGIPALPSGLSQDERRERIRTERRIELAFENHRLFDTRRWKIAEQTDGGPMYGMNVNAGNSFQDDSFYKRSVFETRVFQKKHYLWPIPQAEMDRNKEMVQNPGW